MLCRLLLFQLAAILFLVLSNIIWQLKMKLLTCLHFIPRSVYNRIKFHTWVHYLWVCSVSKSKLGFECLPSHVGWTPDQEPFNKHVLSVEPINVYPISQEKRSKLFILNSFPSREPWAGMPGSPQVPGLIPTTISICFYIMPSTVNIHVKTLLFPNYNSLINW